MRLIRIAVLPIVVAVTGACSADAGDSPITLVSRSGGDFTVTCEASLCEVSFFGATYRTLEGEVVTRGEANLTFDTEIVDDPALECNDIAHDEIAAVLDDWVVEEAVGWHFEDGGAIELQPERAIDVQDVCYEETGRWTGTAGSFRGTGGTYRLVEDSLQSTMTLTPD